MWEFDSWGVDLPAALRLLAAEVGGDAIRPGLNCGGVFARPSHPQLPTGEWWEFISMEACQNAFVPV